MSFDTIAFLRRQGRCVRGFAISDALAAGGEERAIPLSDVPTAAEAGVQGNYSSGWAGVVVPKGTPPAIITKLNAAIVKALNAADLKEQFLAQGGSLHPPRGRNSRALARIMSVWPSW